MSRREQVFAVFDVSSSSVGGAHVLQKHQNTCPSTIILTSARAQSVVQDDIDVARFVADTTKRFTDVAMAISTRDIHHPTHIQVVLASPWYSSQTRTVVYSKPQPFTCTKKLVDSLIETEISHALKETNGAFGPDMMLIERQLSGIKLNGYQTHTPYGKKATTLEFSLILTTSPIPVLGGFRDVIRRVYGDRPVRFTTSPFASFVVVRDRSTSLEHAVVIDVGEEITDVAFVRHGIILYQHSFPMGAYGLYRSVTAHTTGFVQEAEALLESYRLGKLAAPTRRKVERAMTQYTSDWQKGFREILEQGKYGLCLPPTIVMMVHPRFEVLFTEMIENDPFIKYKCATDHISIKYINETMLAGSVGTVEDQASIDSPLATAALYAERLL